MTVTVGYWVFPLFVTIASFVWVEVVGGRDRGTGYGGDIAGAFMALIAIIISLIAWMLYGVLT